MAAMRPLLIDDEARSKIAKVISHAMDHQYYVGADWVPGDSQEFTCDLSSYRCVFTFTRAPDGLYRHLSISVPEPGKYPNPAAVFMIATEFGFTGWDQHTIDKVPDEWICDMAKDSIVIAQEMRV